MTMSSGTKSSGYKGKWLKWLGVYLAIGGVIYLILYFLVLNHGGGGGGGAGY
ncbi:MAG: hypothetical protein ABR548_05700 [Actinomycetota bacterium]|nr:hypothetical protein [Actinomycetota bacterium]